MLAHVPHDGKPGPALPAEDVLPDTSEAYLESLQLLERMHRLMLDLVKDEFERLRQSDLTPVQAMILYNLGEAEVSAGELRSRGMYQGSNVSYNLKKLVTMGYVHHERCEVDRRSVRVRLTEKGRAVRGMIADLFSRHAEGIERRGLVDASGMDEINTALKRMERFWTEQIRYIY